MLLGIKERAKRLAAGSIDDERADRQPQPAVTWRPAALVMLSAAMVAWWRLRDWLGRAGCWRAQMRSGRAVSVHDQDGGGTSIEHRVADAPEQK
jgi:hypothetical protein